MSPPPLPLLPALALLLRLQLEAGADAPPDYALEWRAWAPGLALEAEAALPEEQPGAGGPRRWICRLPAEGDAWTVLVHGEAGGDTWFAVGSGAAEAELRMDLVRVPTPSPSFQDGRLRVTWQRDAAVPAAVAAWQVLRASDGREPLLVGEVGRAATSFVDAPPPGEHAWRLRPVLPDGVTGPLGASSEPLLVPSFREGSDGPETGRRR